MRILYVGLAYDYGVKERGPSYEMDNLEAGLIEWSLSRDGVDVEYFHPDVDGEMDDLRQAVEKTDFDLIFNVAFNESLDLPLDVAQLAIARGKRVLQFDCDASWRFQNWILPRKHRVTDFVTTHSCTVPWYQQFGMRVFKSQWGGSPLYQQDPFADKIYDVSFIGQCHGIRPQIMKGFYDAGIKVHLFGNYWDDYPDWHGYLPDTASKVQAINQSKICLNLSNPHQVGTMHQIKGRHFELPQAAAFQLSTPADDLEAYFEPEKEIVIAKSIQELVEKTRYYLEHEEERVAIAEAGYRRMLREHQWYQRFERLFGAMRLL